MSSVTSTSQIVEQLVYLDGAGLRSNKTKIENLEKKKKLIEDINSKALALQTATNDLYKSLSESSKKITSSKEDIASVSIEDANFKGNLNLEVKQLATNLVLGGDKFSGPIGINGSFEIGDGKSTVTIEVNENDTIDTLKNKINKNKELGIQASVVDGRLTLSSVETGEKEFTFSDADGILNKIGILDGAGQPKTVLQSGQNALFKVNGIDIERTSNTVEDVIEGMKFDLKDVGTVTFKVTEDTDSLVSSVEKFVEKYNDLMKSINEETKKEDGQLRGDSSLNKLKTDLRRAMNTQFTGLFKKLSDIGLEFSSSNYGKDAVLEIKDKDKLKNALSNNRNDVLDLFLQDNNNNGKVDSNDTGILGVLNGFLDSAVSKSGSKKGYFTTKIESIQSSIRSAELKSERLEASLEKKRELYEKQFAYMDTMIENMNSQFSGMYSMMYSSNSSSSLM